MLLRNNYYKVYSAHYGAEDALFHVALLPGCDVYRGHFPGRPVCPGACNIEMMKECVEEAVGKWRIYCAYRQNIFHHKRCK